MEGSPALVLAVLALLAVVSATALRQRPGRLRQEAEDALELDSHPPPGLGLGGGGGGGDGVGGDGEARSGHAHGSGCSGGCGGMGGGMGTVGGAARGFSPTEVGGAPRPRPLFGMIGDILEAVRYGRDVDQLQRRPYIIF